MAANSLTLKHVFTPTQNARRFGAVDGDTKHIHILCSVCGSKPGHPVHAKQSPIPSYLKPYDGQAHHMAKAAQSLVIYLSLLNYSKFTLDEAGSLTRKIHLLISALEHGEELSIAETMQREGLCLACGRPDSGTHLAGCPMREQSEPTIYGGRVNQGDVQTYPVRRPDGGVVRVAVPERE